MIGPELRMIFDRVRESADYIPGWQLQRVLAAELGPAWREQFQQFSEKHLAAASIGQVYWALLPDGLEVAVKVQFQGVVDSIDSDIHNLLALISGLVFLPRDLFIENVAKHMAVELGRSAERGGRPSWPGTPSTAPLQQAGPHH